MRAKSISFSLFLISLLLFLGCTDGPPIERYQGRQKMSLRGSYNTKDPDEITFPVKVLFAIDCSLSMGDTVNGQMAGSDPHFLRIEAVRDFIDTYNSNESVSFEIMLWNNDVFETTRTTEGRPGFTKDPNELNRVLNNARNDTLTDYLGTLDGIYSDILRDINQENEDFLFRSKYIVVFLSDGVSNVQGVRQPDNDIFNSVEEIAEMTENYGVGSFNFHTFLLLGMFPPTTDGQEARVDAEATLQGMADHGDGRFELFESAEAIDFINVIDMRLMVEYKLKYAVVYNFSVHAGQELVYADSDFDGLIDNDEYLYGTNPQNKDSDGDGLSDYFEIALSVPGAELDPLVADSPCNFIPDSIWIDQDKDGLSDCEEYVKGTNRRVTDTDSDGIPDGIEFLSGTNPLEIQDTKDSDFDGMVDWLEVQQHTNVLFNDPKVRKLYGYRYDFYDNGFVPHTEQGSDMPSYVRQYEFDITNIDIMDTLGLEQMLALDYSNAGSNQNNTGENQNNEEENQNNTAGHSGPTNLFRIPTDEELASGAIPEEHLIGRPGDNLLIFYIAEVPEDRPDNPPLVKMAMKVVNIDQEDKNIILTPSDFMEIQ